VVSTVPARVLELLAVLSAGLAAGVLFAVALSVVPAFAAMPPDRYVYTHGLIGPHFDPTMPVIVLAGAAANVALACLADTAPARGLYAVAAAAMAAVSVVSHLCNVPINRRVRGAEPDALPAGWADPRPLWRRWHLLRTGLACAALVADGLALVHL
jgi:uncharacterized membrane protein